MSSYLEIVELMNGDIVLQRADGKGEALMTIHFSDESKGYLPASRLEVARAMIHAGIETASQINKKQGGKSTAASSAETITDGSSKEDLSDKRVLH